MFINQDISFTSIAIAMGQPKRTAPRMTTKDVEQLMNAPVDVSQTIGGVIFSSPRIQLEISIIGNKLQVKDVSGKKPTKSSKVTNILCKMHNLLKAPITAYGLNYQLTYSLDSQLLPGSWIADKLLRRDRILELTDQDVSFATVSLHILTGDRMWNLGIAPDGNIKSDKLIINLNSHKESPQMPSKVILSQEYVDEFKKLESFMQKFN